MAHALTANDPAPVTTALTSTYGQSLCVMRSRFTQPQIDHTADAFTALMQHGPVYGLGASGLNPDAEPNVEVELTAVTANIAALADRQPSGLVILKSWLEASR